MSNGIKHILVVGGGIGGMSAAIACRAQGIAVDLIDIDPLWRVYGAGITITGPTLRAFRQLGILEEVRREGFFFEQVRFFDQDGNPLGAMATPVLEDGLPPAGGILRPALHRILSERTRAAGVDIRLGVTAVGFAQSDAGVCATFSDGTERRYDAVVGSDGANSSLRQHLFANAPPLAFTGQGCWRLLADRPPDLTCSHIYFGNDNGKVGINPCAPDKVYLFASVSMPGNPFIGEDDLVDGMRRILAPYGGHVRDIHDTLGSHSSIIYRPLSTMLLPAPWHRGAVGLIGDAVHPTTPHLASGAGISVEDGLVLAWEMGAAPDAETAWERFTARRFARARLVVENSLSIVNLERDPGNGLEVKRLMSESAFELAKPI